MPRPTHCQALATLTRFIGLALAGTPPAGRAQATGLRSWPLDTPGSRGEVWLPESGTEHLSVIRTA